LNKLAILALSLLLFFGAMLWYLANASLNQYIESQISLQGEYYTDQKVSLTQSNFSSATGTGLYSNLTLKNHDDTAAIHTIKIDNVTIELENNQSSSSLITIAKLTINSLQIWQEDLSDETSKISTLHHLKHTIIQKLATDYPEFYPEISAEIYAKSHPDLNIELKNIEDDSNTIKKSTADTNQAIIKKLAKKSKRLRIILRQEYV